MKIARLVVLGVALAAGGVAALLAGISDQKAPEAPPPAAAKIDTTDILIAKADIGLGETVTADKLAWQAWPSANASPAFVRKPDRANAIEQLTGSIARAPFSAGEPIREEKLIKANGSGYMAAILPSGMRAVSVDISPESGAGGFILPNDHVDVVLTRRDKQAEKASGVETVVSETILTNVRVLAIDQAPSEKEGQRAVVGRTATLELAPAQVETLQLSRQMGSISLALRSIVDSNKNSPETAKDDRRSTSINIVRFGVSTTTTSK